MGRGPRSPKSLVRLFLSQLLPLIWMPPPPTWACPPPSHIGLPLERGSLRGWHSAVTLPPMPFPVLLRLVLSSTMIWGDLVAGALPFHNPKVTVHPPISRHLMGEATIRLVHSLVAPSSSSVQTCQHRLVHWRLRGHIHSLTAHPAMEMSLVKGVLLRIWLTSAQILFRLQRLIIITLRLCHPQVAT